MNIPTMVSVLLLFSLNGLYEQNSPNMPSKSDEKVDQTLNLFFFMHSILILSIERTSLIIIISLISDGSATVYLYQWLQICCYYVRQFT